MGYYFLIFGSLALGYSIWVVCQNFKLFMTGVWVRGQIVGVDKQMRRGDSQRKKIYFHPIVEFETPEQNVFQFTFGSGSSRKQPVVGTEVAVVYPSDRPDKATLNSFMGLWAGPFAAAVLGGGCLYGGIQLLFFGA